MDRDSGRNEPREPDGTEPDSTEPGSTADGLGRLAEGLVRDWTTNASVLLSLIVAGAGVAVGTQPWLVVGPVVGVAAAVLAFWTIARKWPAGRTWITVGAILAVDIVLLVVMFAA